MTKGNTNIQSLFSSTGDGYKFLDSVSKRRNFTTKQDEILNGAFDDTFNDIQFPS